MDNEVPEAEVGGMKPSEVKNVTFEMEVKDIKTSVVRQDICPMEGTLVHHGEEVHLKMVASSDDKWTFKDLFGEVGKTVTFQIIENAQKTLV